MTSPAGSSASTAVATPRPTLTLADAVGIIVGIIIGAGIFKTPALIAGNVDSTAMLVLAWIIGGVISLIGALCYAELASTYPDAGGDYHFLTRAFGQRLSFLFAWGRLTVIQTGSIALLAFVFGDYVSEVLPLGPFSTAVYAALVVAGLTALHVAGRPRTAFAQNLLTAVEILGVLLVAFVGLFGPGAAPATATGASNPAGFGLVMVFVLLTYGGWNEASYVSAEVRHPGRNMVRALVLSILVVTVLYVVVNVALVRGLGLAGLAASKAPAADLLEKMTGRATAVVVILIVLGALTRRGFETMVSYTAPIFWTFILLAGIALFILRRREPTRPRPFQVPFYPVTPIIFCVTCVYLLYASLAYTGFGALLGVAVVGAGAIVLVLTSRAS